MAAICACDTSKVPLALKEMGSLEEYGAYKTIPLRKAIGMQFGQ